MAKPSPIFCSGLSRINILLILLFFLITSCGVYSVYLRVSVQEVSLSPPAQYIHINEKPQWAYIGGSRLGLSGEYVVDVTVTVTVIFSRTYILSVSFDNGRTVVTSSTTRALSPGTHTLTLPLSPPTSYLPNPSLTVSLEGV